MRGFPFAVLFLLSLAASAPAQRPDVAHIPPVSASPGEPLVLSAAVTPAAFDDIVEAALHVKVNGAIEVVPVLVMTDRLVAEVPSRLIASESVEYRFSVLLDDGTELAAPTAESFFRVPVVRSGAASGVEIVSPSPGVALPEQTNVEIAAVFDPPLDPPWEAIVLLDGEDITSLATVTEDLLITEPIDTSFAGQHEVSVSVLTASRLVEASSTFIVLGDDERLPAPETARGPLSLSGRLEIGWAAALAETTAAESLDVYLPYEETSMPSFSFYASGGGPGLSVLAWAGYDPIYDDRVSGSLRVDADRWSVEVGDVFPTLTEATMQWASGPGGVVSARLGRARTELVALRLSEADTVAGFGWYSRFALGVSERLSVGTSSEVELAYVRTFDREGSIPEEARLDAPLTNDAAALVVRHAWETVSAEAEAAWSTSSGAVEGEGASLRARLEYALDYRNRLSLEYTRNDSGYYAPASIATQPGEEDIEAEFAVELSDHVRLSGDVGASRTRGSSSGVDPDGTEWRASLRAEGERAMGNGRVSVYALARYDEVPYEDYTYRLIYGATGVSARLSRVSAAVRASLSRSETDTERSDPGLSADLRADLVPDRWSVRTAVRWDADTGDDEDAKRVTTTLESRWTLDDIDLTLEWQRLDRDDAADPEQSYTVDVLRGAIGLRF